jgi:peptidoglycan/LPS O-acetylase OafA/YrhL
LGKENSKHIDILDGIRAYAVLMVCVFHFFQVNESGLYNTNRFVGIFLFKVSQLGQRGPELFFILSGFLITGILLDSKKSSKYFTTFYARRFLRIFPLYYFVLFVSFVIVPKLYLIDSASTKVIEKQIWLWTYTSNLSGILGKGGWDAGPNFPWFVHFWSLCVEEHFYLLWPLLIYFCKEKWLSVVMWSIVAISASSVLLAYLFGDRIPLLTWSTIQRAGVLSLGGLISWYLREPEKFKKLSHLAVRLLWPAGILLFLVNLIPRRYGINEFLTFFSSVVFFALLVITSLKGTNITDRLFNHKSLFFIGKISYGIYVYHGLMRSYLKNYVYDGLISHISNGIISSIFYTILCTSLSILIAWASWRLLESPILKFKRVFKY